MTVPAPREWLSVSDAGDAVLDVLLRSRLRTGVLRDPVRACEWLQRLTDPAVEGICDTVSGVDLRILLAEAYQRCQRIGPALDACSDAFQMAQRLEATDWARACSALSLNADLMVLASDPEAERACRALLAVVRLGSDPSSQRLLLSYALLAAAVYRRSSCQEGRRLLAVVQQSHASRTAPEAAITAMLAAAATAMHEGCSSVRVTRPAGPPPPMPGGVLHPEMHDPHPDYLAHRIRARNATHTCQRTNVAL